MTAKREPKRSPERPLRRDSPVAKHLRARGLKARVVVDRLDGEPLTAKDLVEADAALAIFADLEKRTWKAFVEANKTKARVSARTRSTR